MKMRKLPCLLPLTLPCSLLFFSPVWAEGHLVVNLASPSPNSAGSVVILSITNDGDAPTSIYKNLTPFPLLEGFPIPNRLFDVKQIEPKGSTEVRYKGQYVHFVTLPERAFLTIEPGQTVSVSYDLLADYDIKPERHYEVRYRQVMDARPMDDIQGQPMETSLIFSSQESAESNALDIYVTQQSYELSQQNRQTSTSAKNQAPFTAAQTQALNDALDTARVYAKDAYDSYRQLDVNTGSIGWTFIGSARYAWWFGEYGGGPLRKQLPPSDDSKITYTLDAIARRLDPHLTLHPVQFHNGCAALPDSGAVAIAKTNTAYLIDICPYFFNLRPLPSDHSSSSQAGTLIHEISHFFDNPSEVALNGWDVPTYDFGGLSGYTLSGAHAMATSNRSEALQNASNYEFYIVNQPAH